jgi:hypothetical protein
MPTLTQKGCVPDLGQIQDLAGLFYHMVTNDALDLIDNQIDNHD